MGGQASAATGPAIAAVTATTPSASLRHWQVSQLRGSGARSGDSILVQGRGRAWARRKDSARSSERIPEMAQAGPVNQAGAGQRPVSWAGPGVRVGGGSRAGAQSGEPSGEEFGRALVELECP